MDKLLTIFSTRELSILIWIGIGLIAIMFSSNMHEGLGGVLKILFGTTIVIILSTLMVYVGLILFLLYKLELWNFLLLKDTLFWFFTTALVLLFNINKAKTSGYFKNIIKENLKWAIAVEFIVNFYTFSLLKELVLVPSMIFLASIQAVASIDKKNIQVSKLLGNILSVIGILLIAFIVYKTFTNYQEIFTFHTLFSFLLPPFLTVLLIPFLYLLALYMNYEELFVRIKFLTNDNKRKQLLKREILLVANLNLNRLILISKNLNKYNWYHSTETKSYIKSLTQRQL